MADTAKVEIGFVGGGTTSATLPAAALTTLQKAMEQADGGLVELPLEGDGGALIVRPSQVAFLRVLSRESRVGF